MNSTEWFFVTVISVVSIAAGVTIVRSIVDGIVRTKQARIDVEREYLAQMMLELQEIKARLETLRQRDGEREHEIAAR